MTINQLFKIDPKDTYNYKYNLSQQCWTKLNNFKDIFIKSHNG